jgi:hypothetical protein
LRAQPIPTYFPDSLDDQRQRGEAPTDMALRYRIEADPAPAQYGGG